MEIENNKAYIFTADCEIVSIKSREEYFVGQQLKFTKEDVCRSNFFQKLSNVKSIVSIAAVLTVIFSTVFMINILKKDDGISIDTKCTAIISVDINPGIELSINKNDIIISAKNTNEDGKKVLDKAFVEGKKLEDGVNNIVNSAKELNYISESNDSVFVLAVVSDLSMVKNPDKYKSELKKILSLLDSKDETANIIAVFTENSDIIKDADSDNISIGKELLYKYAVSINSKLSKKEIAESSINDLIKKLNILTSGNKLDVKFTKFLENMLIGEENTTVKQTSETKSTSATETELSTYSSDTSVTTIAAVSESDTKNKTDNADTPSYTLSLSGSVNGNIMSFSWIPLNTSSVSYNGKQYSGFCYYKVVASETNPNPVYPGDGYLYYSSDINISDWSVDPSSGNYNQSPTLKAGRTYYFSVTYVFDNGKISSNSISMTVPATAVVTPPSTIQPNLVGSVSGSALNFSWTPLSSSSINYNGTQYNNFNYYKVVASETNSNPIYPNDGYLYYTTDINSSSWSVDPSSGNYNQSPVLAEGRTYYFSITYVFDNGKFTSNTIQLKIPEASSSVSTQQPQISVSSSGNILNFSWTPLNSSSINYNGTQYNNFNYYKIVASETNSTPIYPDDGYLYYTTDINSSSWSVAPSSGDYNHSPDLVSGRIYYFSITYVFDNGKFTSNTVRYISP